MITATRFKFAATPISGGGNVLGNFVEGGGVHAGNRVVTLDVDADTGRHSSVLDPTTTDGGFGARHIAPRDVCLSGHGANDGLLPGSRRYESGSEGGAAGIDAAHPVTHRHDAVLLTLRRAYKQRPKKDCKTAATALTLYWRSPGRPDPLSRGGSSRYPAAGGRATKLGRKPYCGTARL